MSRLRIRQKIRSTGLALALHSIDKLCFAKAKQKTKTKYQYTTMISYRIKHEIYIRLIPSISPFLLNTTSRVFAKVVLNVVMFSSSIGHYHFQ